MIDAMKAAILWVAGLILGNAIYAQETKPIIENERVTVWDLPVPSVVPGPVADNKYDVVRILFSRGAGAASFASKGKGFGVYEGAPPARVVFIALKDHPVAPLPNKSGHPNAFPRPGIKKLLDNNRVTVWDYTWQAGKSTPMHFHDKDVVVVYLDDGALQSTTPDGKKTVNHYSFDFVKFNPRDRTHTELLLDGHEHAIMTELK